MEAILKFELPDDQVEINSAVNGSKWQLALWDLDQYLRTNTNPRTKITGDLGVFG
jgi:hypothetical protein